MSRRLVDGKMPVKSKGTNKGGRPTDLSRELIDKIVSPLRIGVRIPTAAALNDVSIECLRNWVLKGHEDPKSIYGELITEVMRAIAQWETGDVSILHKHAMGAPTEFEKEVVRDKDGSIVYEQPGKPLMQLVRDGEGNPIVRRAEIRSDWRAAAHRLERRLPKYWYRPETSSPVDQDAILTFDAKEREQKPVEALSFEAKIAGAVKKLEEDY